MSRETVISYGSPSGSGGRQRILLGLLVVALVVFLGGRTAISWYVDALWFRSLGYGGVFMRTLGAEWAVFGAFALATFAVLYGTFRGLMRVCRPQLDGASTIQFGMRTIRLPLDGALRWGGLGGGLFVALATGGGMMADWQRYALFWAQPSASGAPDPIFGRPLNFYLFTLPALQSVAGWLMMMAVLVCALCVLFLLLSGGVQLAESRFELSADLPWKPLSAGVAFLLLAIAARVYLGRFGELMTDRAVFAGVGYTEDHVLLGGALLVVLALVAGAVLVSVNFFTEPKLRRLIVAPILAVVCYFGVQLVGWCMASFIVKPNQLVREQPYIAHNIEFTRQAFALDRLEQHEFPAETNIEAADPANNQATLENIRLWDWHALQDTLRQIQEIRTYYDFPDIDIDRYKIDGQMRQLMLAAREISLDKLPENSRTWINEKLIYTHGYGITVNPVNGFTPEGLPTLMLSNMPVESTVPSLTVKRPEIYYGQLTGSDVYVKTRQKEFNFPQGETNSLTSYEGDGGIVMGGLMRRLIIAFDRGDLAKVPFSDDINAGSRLLMRRSIRDRVSELAPFLTLDSDPYIVIRDDGRLTWLLDAFTTADTYPYASHYALGDQPVNYMRNSVKIAIDAYTGATTFYVFDNADPVLAAYRGVFPTLFRDGATMPGDLRRHIRYPELLLKMQASVYGLYHMTNPTEFYNREDLWTVASENGARQAGEAGGQPMDPNFVLMKLPGEQDVEFVAILPFTPSNRNNLIGWIAGRSDGAHYGAAVVYNFPKTRLIDGPLQIEARIDQNAQLSGQLTLWNQQGSHVKRGALLVIPCGKALMYAEPIYLQAERSPMPELRLVVLALQDKLAYGSTFESAMRALFAGGTSSVNAEAAAPEAATEADSGSGSAVSRAAVAPDTETLIAGAARDLADYQRLTAEGKLAEAGQKLEQLKQKLDTLSARRK